MSAANTVTVTLSSGVPKSIRLDEYNNSAGSMVLDAGTSASGVGGPTLSSGSLTTATANELGVAQFAADAELGAGYTTPGAGWTSNDSYTPYWYAEDLTNLDLGAAGSVAATDVIISGKSNANYAVNFAAFKVSGGGGTSVALTGLQSTESVGTLSPVISVFLTGLQSISASGHLSPAISQPLTGLQSTNTTGTLTPSQGQSVALTGLQSVGSLGYASPSISISFTGLQSVSSSGTLTPSGPVLFVPLTGLQSVG
ncbi:MAG: hypothetical protein ACREQ5_12945, partial [Candidatus Dormibacteria bacterium]